MTFILRVSTCPESDILIELTHGQLINDFIELIFAFLLVTARAGLRTFVVTSFSMYILNDYLINRAGQARSSLIWARNRSVCYV